MQDVRVWFCGDVTRHASCVVRHRQRRTIVAQDSENRQDASHWMRCAADPCDISLSVAQLVISVSHIDASVDVFFSIEIHAVQLQLCQLRCYQTRRNAKSYSVCRQSEIPWRSTGASIYESRGAWRYM